MQHANSHLRMNKKKLEEKFSKKWRLSPSKEKLVLPPKAILFNTSNFHSITAFTKGPTQTTAEN